MWMGEKKRMERRGRKGGDVERSRKEGMVATGQSEGNASGETIKDYMIIETKHHHRFT